VLHNRNSIRSQNFNLIFDHAKIPVADRDSAVGITICYRLDGLRIRFRWKRDLQQASRPSLGPAHFPVQWVSALHPKAKATELWRSQPTLSSAKFSETVWIRNQLDVTYVLSFISPLQVAQHVSGNHVPIFRS
jgi:hypothetical protein